MNFLEIVKKANIFSGLQGEIDSVAYATGLQKTLVEFTSAAYLDIQLLRDQWKWMQSYTSSFQWGSVPTSVVNSGVNTYSSLYNPDGTELIYVDYYSWLTSTVSRPAMAKPAFFTIVPETNALILSPVLDTVTVNYVASINPEILSTNTQIPKMPERYHFLIVYKAAMDMGALLGNAEVHASNASRYDMLLSQLLRNQNTQLSVKQRPLV